MWLFSTYLTTAIGHFQFAARGRDFDRHELLYRTEYQSAGGAWVLFLHESTEDPCTSGIPGRIYGGELLLVPHGLFYNYVTYVFYLVSVVCLYLGLARGKGWLFAAGVALAVMCCPDSPSAGGGHDRGRVGLRNHLLAGSAQRDWKESRSGWGDDRNCGKIKARKKAAG